MKEKEKEYKARILKKSENSTNVCLCCGQKIPEGRKYRSVKCQNILKHKMKLKEVEEKTVLDVVLKE